MVNPWGRCYLLVSLLLLSASEALHAQTRKDLERRVAELEEKIALLERRLNQVSPASAAPAPPQPAPLVQAAKEPITETPGPALVPVSIAGDYQRSPEGETRLPVAGYMD